MTFGFIEDIKLPEDFEDLQPLSIGGNAISIPDGESELTNAEFRQLRQAYRRMTNRYTNLKGQIDQAKIEIRTIRRYARMAKKRLDQHLESQGQRVENE